MKQVFISYSSKDFSQAQTVRNVLEQNGITCWMAPADIPGGSNYTKEIPIAIRGCQAFVLMLSNNAQNSHWVLKELDSAVNAGKIILPFQLEDVPLSDEFNFLLTGAQRYDAYQRKSEALNLLVARIKAIIGAAAPEEPQLEPLQPEAQEPEPEKTPFRFPGFKRNDKKTGTQVFDGITCPACGSVDVLEAPNQEVPRGFLEGLYVYVMSVVSVCAGAVLGMLPWGIVITVNYSGDYTWLLLLGGLAGIAFGGWCGWRIIKRNLRSFHIRKHIAVKVCRCNTCRKKFRAIIDMK